LDNHLHLVLCEGDRLSRQQLRAIYWRAAKVDHSEEDEERFMQFADDLINLKVVRSTLEDEIEEEFDEDSSGTDAVKIDSAQAVPVVEFWRGQYRVSNLVGSARMPASDVVLEILPKVNAEHYKDGADIEAVHGRNRESLMRMWSYAADLNLREDDTRNDAGMREAHFPFHEWLVNRFLIQVKELLSRGIRFQYIERDENLLSPRGRVMIAQNLRSNTFAPHRFYCRFEELSPDRPENRLILATLKKIVVFTSDDGNRREASHIANELHEVPPSHNIDLDFALWRDDRLMAHYREIRKTCHWILHEMGPAPVHGDQQMFGRFVRMNDVFERYVSRWMAEKLQSARSDHKLIDQTVKLGANSKIKDLAIWEGNVIKNKIMKPDILIYLQSRCMAILDTKWKRRDDATATSGDMYQLFAYASHWLATDPTVSHMALIYPATSINKNSEFFRFQKFPNIVGYALRFQLPIRINNEWNEGITGIFANREIPQWLELCRSR